MSQSLIPKDFWRSMNDLALLFSARLIAFPLIILLVIKLYFLNPTTLAYSVGLVLLTTLAAMRWSIHLIAKHKLAFLEALREEKTKHSDNQQ